MSQQQTWLFISYKTGESSGLTFQARAIKKELTARETANYHVFLDKDSLEPGLDWNKQIYEHIPRSDILLLLLAEETADSVWVRREVDVAKGAQVTILPVLIREFDGIQETLDRFDLPRLQAVKLLEGSEDEYENLFEAIENRKDDTANAQRRLLEHLNRAPDSHPFAEAVRDYRTFTRPDEDGPEILIAAGDIMAMQDIDVFVNSENDYMQMARIFGDRTVSAMLRFYGSHFNGANQLIDDTVQNELNEAVKQYPVRPLGLGTVIVTSAGREQSRLVRRNKARYIFHTAVVSVQDNQEGTGKELGPINNQGLMDAVRNTLEKVEQVNSGEIQPAGESIKSIIFPLLATGRGGLSADKVATLMARSIRGFIIDHPKTALERIYICAFTEEDAITVEDALIEADFVMKGVTSDNPEEQ